MGDTLSRLRAVVAEDLMPAKHEALFNEATTELTRLRAENERLRVALRPFIDSWSWAHGCGFPCDCSGGKCRVQDNARAALEGSEDE